MLQNSSLSNEGLRPLFCCDPFSLKSQAVVWENRAVFPIHSGLS
ncbi:hypothetical protein SynMITS9220_00373 [Synechococcus sp. MIT S9220]|nr:hypothetical protein SynMITS9220_00373 [Synechococcus sp. MIT S9220]